MLLIVGLGNPGEKYSLTRHNAGFMFIDFLANHSEVIKPWKFDKYINAEIAHVSLKLSDAKQLTTILAKPQIFMNRSGESVSKIMQNQNIDSKNLLIAHDDLDLELGNFKIQNGTGPKVHNGLSSIEESLGLKDFLRIRLGVDNRKGEFRIPGEAYVLQNFTVDEITIVKEMFERSLNQLLINLK